MTESTEMDRVYSAEREEGITEYQRVQNYYRNVNWIMGTAEFRREYDQFCQEVDGGE